MDSQAVARGVCLLSALEVASVGHVTPLSGLLEIRLLNFRWPHAHPRDILPTPRP